MGGHYKSSGIAEERHRTTFAQSKTTHRKTHQLNQGLYHATILVLFRSSCPTLLSPLRSVLKPTPSQPPWTFCAGSQSTRELTPKEGTLSILLGAPCLIKRSGFRKSHLPHRSGRSDSTRKKSDRTAESIAAGQEEPGKLPLPKGLNGAVAKKFEVGAVKGLIHTRVGDGPRVLDEALLNGFA
ncbi:hypothetical protein FRC05_008375 [Tulasnella sp. 425]|nr:hypothetical protein FRC05_008375 [Tulasnella sp. 425]